MHYLTEDPLYLLIGLGVAAVACLLALKITQQGKFLIWAGVLAAVAAGLFLFERFYVTDAERIEAVVYDLARAIEASDVDRVKSHLDDKVTLGRRDRRMDGSFALGMVLPLLKRTRFDFVRVAQLTTSAGSQTKQGTAEFKVTATGVFNEGGSEIPVVATATEWSLGFSERSPGVWKVTRVTAIKLPGDVAKALFGR
jgi:ketosteroid isomerase-like protein